MTTATMTKTKVAKKVKTLVSVKAVVDTAEELYSNKIHTRSNFFLGLCEAIAESIDGWGQRSGDLQSTDHYAIGFLASEIINEYSKERLKEFFGQSLDNWVKNAEPEDVLVWAIERAWWPTMVANANSRADSYDPYEDTDQFVSGCNCIECLEIKSPDPDARYEATLFDNCPCNFCESQTS